MRNPRVKTSTGDRGGRAVLTDDRSTKLSEELRLDVHVRGELRYSGVTLPVAAELLGLSAADVAWAIDEHGRCDAADANGELVTAVPAGGDLHGPLTAG